MDNETLHDLAYQIIGDKALDCAQDGSQVTKAELINLLKKDIIYSGKERLESDDAIMLAISLLEASLQQEPHIREAVSD